jgi:lipid-A-disaccharide synthase-like uncharacterized protein
MNMLLGIIGLTCIAIGWIPQVIEIMKKRKSNLNLGFAILYTIGSLALVLYALQISDWIFVALNGFAFLMSGVGLFYTIVQFKPNKK